MSRTWILGFLLLTMAAPAAAQQSASFKIEGATFNSGGHPVDAISPGSASFLLSLGGSGDLLSGSQPASASFSVAGGFVTSYPPPGEVTNVLFTDATSLQWDMEPAAVSYNLYSGDVTAPWDPGYGLCSQSGLTSPSATEGSTPAPGQILFILVTAKNSLFEEGTKGFDFGNILRPIATPCP